MEADQPKGIEVVKESITKLKLMQPIKKSEGSKIAKVELTISVNGVAIQDPKSKSIFFQFPLHRISYCADDKAEKKYFSFIAKDTDSTKHLCFVFMSEKMSEEIILTIGQAFDLAYAKFIESSGKELETRKQLIILQKKICDLEDENKQLKERLKLYENSDTVESSPPVQPPAATAPVVQNGANQKLSFVTVPALQPPPPSSKNQTINLIDVDIEQDTTVSLLDTTISDNDQTNVLDLLDQDFNPRAQDSLAKEQTLANSHDKANQNTDAFGSEPFQVNDPFGMGHFTSAQLNSAIVRIDKRLAEMRVCS